MIYLILILLNLFVFTVSAQSLQPGIWKVKTVFKLNGIPLPTQDDQECISASEAKDAKSTIAKELKRNDCEIKTWKIAGKNLETKISCSGSDVKAEGVLKGQFTAKSYRLTGKAEGTYQDIIPSVASLSLAGDWVKDCAK